MATSNTANRKAASAGAAVADSMESFRETAADYIDAGRERAMELEHTVEQGIQERPITAALVCLGVGFLLGCCVMARR